MTDHNMGESDMEQCPYCELKFATDQGDYHTPGRVTCPECGYDFDAEHDVDYNDKMGGLGDSDDDLDVDPDAELARRKGPVGEGVNFDKFMDKILISEGAGRKATPVETSPQRIRAARHQDRPLNKTRFGVK